MKSGEGTTWTFRLTRGPKHEPVVPGFVSILPPTRRLRHLDQGEDRSQRLRHRHLARRGGQGDDQPCRIGMRAGSWSSWTGPTDSGPGPSRTFKRIDEPGEPRFRLIDEAGGTATVSGPVDAKHPAREARPLGLAAGDRSQGVRKSSPGTVIDQGGRPIAGANVTIFYTYRQWGAMSGSSEHRVQHRRPGPVQSSASSRGSRMRATLTQALDRRLQGRIRGRGHGHLRVQAGRRREPDRRPDPPATRGSP